MTGSFGSIDYSLRVGKYAERRMLSDIIRRLSSFAPVETYEYVGFGSVWFADFLLFHKSVGFRQMTSIESESDAEQRVLFNRPYKIKVAMGYSGAVLPHLDWGTRKVIWLDYDDPISRNMLVDANTVASNAQSGSLMIISVPCSFAPETRGKEDPSLSRLERFSNRFDRGHVPDNATEMQLYGWSFGQLSMNMFAAQIKDALETRALTRDRLCFREVCRFEYADGAKMATIVGVFYSEHEAENLQQCSFDSLDFIEAGSTVRIESPNLTPKEARHIEAQMPWAFQGPVDYRPVPSEEFEKFARFYRYFPKFSSIEA